MIRAIVIADDDGLVGQCPAESADLLISLGDLWDKTIEKACRRHEWKKVYGIKGNHDSNAPFPSFVTPLHCSTDTFCGLSFGGFDGSWKYKPRGHFLFEQDEVRNMLRNFPRVDVFVAHNSPAGVHERDLDVHQGFNAFMEYLLKHQPKFFIHGHQHVNRVTMIGDTQVIGVFGENLIELA
jgi:uncharacterized protein